METAEYLCGECANEVKDEDKAVYCEGACQAWFHAQCVNVNDELYAHLSDSEEKWEWASTVNKNTPLLRNTFPIPLKTSNRINFPQKT